VPAALRARDPFSIAGGFSTAGAPLAADGRFVAGAVFAVGAFLAAGTFSAPVFLPAGRVAGTSETALLPTAFLTAGFGAGAFCTAVAFCADAFLAGVFAGGAFLPTALSAGAAAWVARRGLAGGVVFALGAGLAVAGLALGVFVACLSTAGAFSAFRATWAAGTSGRFRVGRARRTSAATVSSRG
jgi:hypothetical protein